MMRRRPEGRFARPLLAGLVMSLLAVSTASADGSHDARSGPRARGDEMTITAQDFAIDPDSVLTLSIELPGGFDTATLGADGSNAALVIDVHQEAATLATVRDVLDGERTPVRDSLTISLALADADPRIGRPSATELTVAVQTETVTSAADTVRLPNWGVYPITIELTDDGETIADVSTFVARRDVAGSRDDARDDLAVGIVLGTTRDPTILADGSSRPSSGELAELERLADALEAADAASSAGGADPLPRTVRVEPSTLAVLADVDPELAARLVRLLRNGDVVAQPRLPFDPSSAIAAGRENLYTRLLREGEDVLSDALPGTRVDRTLLIATDPISGQAVSLRRDLGTRMVVLPFDRYLGLDGNIGAFTDTSQLVDLATTDRGEVPAMLIDPVVAELLEREGDEAPLATAVGLVAQLVALAGQIDDSGGSVARHGIVLARGDGGVIDPQLLGVLSALLVEADGLRVVDPSDLASAVDTQVIDGRDLRVTPHPEAGVDLRERFASIDEISRDVLGTASMLPADEPLVTSWTEILGAVVSTALDDDAAAAMIGALRDQVDVYRNGVRGPDPYTFRFTGRSGSIKFKLRNLTDRALVVRITISSAKLEFRDPDLPVELPPLQETEVTMPFEALSNGTSSVFLRIFTPAPEPSPDTQIVSDIILTARITTLTGLGQLVTGAALLVLCTWWIRHWRQSRRRRLTEAVAPRHPAAASPRPPPLAPDAAASRVPPS